MFPLTLVIIFVPNSWNNQGTIKVYNCPGAWIFFYHCTFIVQAAIAAILTNVTSGHISIDLGSFLFFFKMSALCCTPSPSWLLSRDVTSLSLFCKITTSLQDPIQSFHLVLSASNAVGLLVLSSNIGICHQV